MGLTRPRAHQIYDIDYKQAVRVITVSNVTLAGGAPSTVDGVSLSLKDRVLVTGQTAPAENGLYIVSVLGTGSNGTWTRSEDGNQTGEILAGMIVMVTEGTTYADTQWKLTTNDPIVIGTTALVFEQSSAYAFGTISANSTQVLADKVGDTLTLTPGNNLIITADASTDTVTFSVTQSPSFTGTLSATGNSNVGNLGTAGLIIASGNVTGGNLNTAGIVSGGSLTVTGNANVGNLGATAVVATGAISGSTTLSITGNANVGNLGTAGLITATGNITTSASLNLAGNIVDTGALFLITGASGNVTLAPGGTSVVIATTTGANITGTLNATGNANVGNLGATNANLTAITVSGNANVGNLGTAGLITATGNITGGNLTTTGIANIGTLAVTGNETVAGTSTVTGNITGGNLKTSAVTVGSTGAISGVTTISASGNANVGNIGATNAVLAGSLTGATTISASGNANVGNLGATNANLTAITVTGNANVGNIGTTAVIATGAISGSTTLSITGNANVGNLGTAGLITATGNITGGNLITVGLTSTGTLTVTGNITGGNSNVTGMTTVANASIRSAGYLYFYDSDNTNYVAFKANAAIGTNVIWTWPQIDGTSGQVLSTDGAGTLSWVTGGGGGGGGTGGYNNSTLTAFPGSAGNSDYGNGETYVGQSTTTDAFGISLISTFTCMDPLGSLQGPVDLGVLT